ncbi:MAG: hypothetical protein IJU66_02220 [Oscillospiraceae bacterium]|nr:hypothetical protein [Oscillospiraceae bacterium]
MKRLAAFLSLLLICLALTACHRYLPENTGQPAGAGESAPDPAAPASEPVQMRELNVEFSIGSRDAASLLTLQKEFPQALKSALGKNGVEVEAVNVTFGASGEATVSALKSGSVQIAFLSAEDAFSLSAGEPLAAENASAPELSLSVIAVSPKLDKPAVVTALRDSLPALAPTLSRYTGEESSGMYSDALLSRLAQLYETGDTVLCTASASVGSKTLTFRGIGHRLNNFLWGVRAVEVYDGEELLQTLALSSETADDPSGGLGDYTECPEPELLLRAVDVNFDGCDDLEVFGWCPNNTIPYFYWIWDAGTQRYAYAFRLQGPVIDEDSKTIAAEYRESAALSWRDVYEWQNDELTLVSHEALSE